MKFIYKCKIVPFNDSFKLTCSPLNVTSAPNRSITFYGTKERFRLFLKRTGAVDSVNHPISKNRDKTFTQMIDDAISGTDPYVYIWSHKLPKENTVRESVEKNNFLESDKSAKEFLNEAHYIADPKKVTYFIKKELGNLSSMFKTFNEQDIFTSINEIINNIYLFRGNPKDIEKLYSSFIFGRKKGIMIDRRDFVTILNMLKEYNLL